MFPLLFNVIDRYHQEEPQLMGKIQLQKILKGWFLWRPEYYIIFDIQR